MVYPVTAHLKVFEQISPHADLTDNTGVSRAGGEDNVSGGAGASYAGEEDYSEFGIWN